MPHDGNTCGVLDGPRERVAPARDDRVDIHRSCVSNVATSARVSMVCMNGDRSAVRVSAAWIARARAAAVRADSLPPLRIAALPI